MSYIWKEPKVFCETDENGKKKYGFTNQNGKVVPAIFDSIGTFVAGYATATKDYYYTQIRAQETTANSGILLLLVL